MSSIKVNCKTQCIGDSIIRFTVTNHGSGDMGSFHEYRLYYDNELAYTGSFQLTSGKSLIIDVSADGSTVRLEADQHPLHPGKSKPRTTSEGCGKSTSSIGYWPESTLDDSDYFSAEICLPIRDSYDPNDKKVIPSGVTSNHYVPERASLNYTIRFQNTGTDTAYNIIIVDTIPNTLDMSTLKIIGSSHHMNYQVEGSDISIIVVSFDDVNLVDSLTNEQESHGFFSFTIRPVTNITPGCLIENFADIYFDFNSAIRTDTASVIALDTIIFSNKIINVNEISDTSISIIKTLDVLIYPNPTSEIIIIQGFPDGVTRIQITDSKGRLIDNKITSTQIKIDVSNYNYGVYYILLDGDKFQKQTFKMVKN